MLSIGIASIPTLKDVPSFDALIKMAERTLHQVKQAGGNQIRVYQPE